MSDSMAEMGFRERPVEKLDTFVKCNDDETRDRLIAEEKRKAELIKRELSGEKPVEAAKEKPVPETSTAPQASPQAPTMKADAPAAAMVGSGRVRERLRTDFLNAGNILAERTGIAELGFSDVERDIMADGTVDIFGLTDENFKQVGKAVSAAEMGLVLLNKAMIYNKAVKAKTETEKEKEESK